MNKLKTMKNFKNILALNNAIVENNGQLNLEILLNQRANLGEGWEYFNISNEEKRNAIDEVVILLGGWSKFRDALRYRLNNTPLSHWGLQRIVFYGGKWRYVAGQDGAFELKQIRDYIKA